MLYQRFTIFFFDATRFILNISEIIISLNGLLMRCLASCLQNVNCESLAYKINTRICTQYKNSQLIPEIYANNGIGKIYKKSIRV